MNTPSVFTKSGNKSTNPAKLDKDIFGLKLDNHELLRQAYEAYLANGRINLAKTKKRGEVRGGGRKPWRQKGTGRARFGSSRNPIWRGGGIAFGPTGLENYAKKMNAKAKRLALNQALSLASEAKKLTIIEESTALTGTTKNLAVLLKKIGVQNRILWVVEHRDLSAEQASRNIPKFSVVSATNLNVYDVLNADAIVIDKSALAVLQKTTAKKMADVGDKNE